LTTNHTLADVVEYIMANRRGKAFYKWTRSEITLTLAEAVNEGTFLYSVDDRGNINGCVHGTRFVKDNVLFVHNILTTGGTVVLINFIKRFRELFFGYRLEATRRGRTKIYNTDKFVSKFLTLN